MQSGKNAMNVRKSSTAVLMLAVLSGALPAWGDDQDLERVSSQMEALQDETGRMQRSFDKHLDEVAKQIAHNADATTRMTAALASLHATLEKQATKSAEEVDEVSGLGETLSDGLDRARERLTKATARLDVRYPVRPAASSQKVASETLPDVLYDRALRDYKLKKNSAWQEFYDYAVSHPGTDLGGASYFYLAEIRYDKADYRQAIGYYNLALTMAPSGSKAAAARLKKGAAYVHLGLRDEGIREFEAVVKLYPGSGEAAKAKKTIALIKAIQ
jgi:TolA-binding protein